MNLQEKEEHLKQYLRSLGSLAVAFSGGTDSTYLLKVAADTLGNQVLAVTARSSTYPERELRAAEAFAKKIGVQHIVVDSEELNIGGFAENPVNRCYYCKRELFKKIFSVASKNGNRYVADGTNLDDLGDFRPGMRAAQEMNVVSPLREAGMTKADIRLLSKELGLPTWNKPAFACLASRFPYGQKITMEKLAMVDKAEEFLMNLGFRQVRVRYHENLARIEVAPEERSRFFSEELMDRIDTELKKIGFLYVTLDMKGYRTGSMNETIGRGKTLTRGEGNGAEG